MTRLVCVPALCQVNVVAEKLFLPDFVELFLQHHQKILEPLKRLWVWTDPEEVHFLQKATVRSTRTDVFQHRCKWCYADSRADKYVHFIRNTSSVAVPNGPSTVMIGSWSGVGVMLSSMKQALASAFVQSPTRRICTDI